MPPQTTSTAKQDGAREVVDILMEISGLLNTHLERNTLSLCISMIENGINPEALATVITELRKEQSRAVEARDGEINEDGNGNGNGS